MAPVEAPTPAEEMTKAAQMAQEAQTVQTARTAQAAQMVQAAQLELPKMRAKRTAVGDVRAWTLAVLLLGVKSCARGENPLAFEDEVRRETVLDRACTHAPAPGSLDRIFVWDFVFSKSDGFTSLAFSEIRRRGIL